MKHEREMRSDIDYLIDILRSNPQKKFTVARVRELTGLPISFLRKWVDVLGEQGHIRFFYGISDEEFVWNSNNKLAQEQTYSQIDNPKTLVPARIAVKLKEYEKESLGSLLEDIDILLEQTKKLSSRISVLKKSRNSDLTATGIAQHKLEEKKLELVHLISQAKKFRK